MNYWQDKGMDFTTNKKDIKFTSKEAEFLCYQLSSRKDYFQEEMNNGVKTTERLKELENDKVIYLEKHRYDN